MRALRTGDVSPETGTYTAACGCRVQQRVPRGAPMPRCLICERTVVWYRTEGRAELVFPVVESPPQEAHA